MDFISLGRWDILIVAAYLVVLYIITMRVRSKQHSGADYYLAGRNAHWLFISVATFASLFSTVTFVTIPAEVYANGLQLSLVSLIGLPLLPVAAHIMLKFFFLSPTFTAYEYLEKRFNLLCRILGASFFTMAKFAYVAIVLYLTSIIFKSVFGVPVVFSISVIGALAVFYTVIGGMRGVIYTEFAQSVMLIAGVAAILYFVSKGIDHHWIDKFKELASTDKRFTADFLLRKDFYKVQYHDRFNLLLVLYAFWHQPFMQTSSDQLTVQRMLSTKGFKQACKSIYGNISISLPVLFLMWFIGVGLVLFYKNNSLPAGIEAKNVLGYFMKTQLPAPLPGFMCAAMLAMVMGAVTGTINSLSAVVQYDLIAKLPWKKCFTLTVAQSKVLTLALGSFAILLSLLVAIVGESKSFPLIEYSGILMSGWPILTVTFFFGVLCPWVKPWTMVTGMCCGAIGLVTAQVGLYISQPVENRIGFAYMQVIALGTTVAVTLLLNIIDRRGYTAPIDTTAYNLTRKKSEHDTKVLVNS